MQPLSWRGYHGEHGEATATNYNELYQVSTKAQYNALINEVCTRKYTEILLISSVWRQWGAPI